LVDKYGFISVDHVLKLRPPCPNCGFYDLIDNGSEEFNGILQKKYICKNKKCRTQFRSPLIRQIKKIHELSSERCPKCGKTNCYTFSNNGTIWELTCESCSHVRFFTPFTSTNSAEKKSESKDKKPSPKKDGNNGRLDSYMS
jgi:DNA-directed RNA polymerase subunit RPC12/RpoP